MKRIFIKNIGNYALVDDDLFDYLNQFHWIGNNKGYVYRHIYLGNRKTRAIMLHREIMDAKKGQIVDHINMNRLNNLRINLRFATNGQNKANGVLYKNNKSGYKGVTWNIGVNKWVACIRVNKKVTHLGCFELKEDAARAYDQAAKKYHGEFAYLNFGD